MTGEQIPSLADVLECPRCCRLLGTRPAVIDSCVSVALETARPAAQVVAEYLRAQHLREQHDAEGGSHRR